MPGIVGLITRMPRQQAELQLQNMVAALRHESFYETGTWIDESLGVYVGWITPKKSFADGMPLHNQRGDVVLIFSGEEFPEPGTAQRLKHRDHGGEARGPSYLVSLYEEDATFPANMNGRFHGLLIDQSSGLTTLFNDRWGMHRIYYHQSKDTFYFAAEAKAILAVRPELRKLDTRSLGEYVACGCVLENRTLYEKIQVLAPASSWTFQNALIKSKGSYFHPRDWEEQLPLEPEPYYQALREVFSQNLGRYLNGQEQIGMSLTGGLDSRMIMAWQKAASGSLPCYSFVGSYRDCQDVRLARKVARACGQPHQVIPVGDEFLSRFPRYAERTVYLTDGSADVSRTADLYLNELGRQIAPVRMTGNYGGEVLRRVRAFKPVSPLPDLFCPELQPYFRQAAETYAGLVRGNPLSFAVFSQAPWHHYGLLALEQSQLSLRSPFLDNDFVRTVFRAPASAFQNDDVCLRLIADGNPGLQRIRTDRGLAGSQGRLSTAVSRKLLQFTFKAEYAYGDGMPQWMAGMDHLLSAFRLERAFLGRHKFAHYRVWYRDTLSSYVREMLLDPRTLSRPHFQGGTVERIVNRHLKGDRNYTTEIHQLLTLELLHRLFLDAR
jgi:asparagine synthase (glutamine-hydrolysing)